jgi:hypothetical protein
MRAVAAAAERKVCVRVLSECEQRRDGREAEGCEQQDGEKAAHLFQCNAYLWMRWNPMSENPASLRAGYGHPGLAKFREIEQATAKAQAGSLRE